MTDITELAQREKFEAWLEGEAALPWGYLKKRRTSDGAYHEPNITDMWSAWKAAGAVTIEALEKAQTENELARGQLFIAQRTLLNQQAKIAGLESRTVTVKQFDEFQICHYGATEDYAKGYIDCQNNFFKWLTAAGIKWEAE
ncbi:hypothetical protein [Entomohabitans teleogrylli]|uniref:hypothetical protein n=1 Tax=Entomohabitans teleogrylli TaxID=1384589 RepID=UPI00073D495A|nr:hypothetical protein [Entomohabitans teleogrylli]